MGKNHKTNDITLGVQCPSHDPAGELLSQQCRWSEVKWLIDRIKSREIKLLSRNEFMNFRQEEVAMLVEKVSLNWVADFNENQLMKH